MIRLGIDPGSVHTGFAVTLDQGRGVKLLSLGVIDLPAKKPLSERLKLLFQELESVILEHKPQSLAVEKVFLGKNVQSAFKLGHARGVAMLLAAQHRMDVNEYAPKEIKKTIVGHGGADKFQIQNFLKQNFKLPEDCPHDATDALAIAYTNFLHSPPTSEVELR